MIHNLVIKEVYGINNFESSNLVPIAIGIEKMNSQNSNKEYRKNSLLKRY